MKKAIIILMLLTVFSKLLGLGREMVLSYFYGASAISDAYLIAYTIPGTLFAIIALGLSTSYIPIFNTISAEKKYKNNIFTNSVINFMIIISVLIIIIVLFFTNPIVKLFASGFEGETLSLAIEFTKISIFGIIFSGVTFILTAYLQNKGNFAVPALLGIPFNLIIVISITLSCWYSSFFLAYGLLIAMSIQAICLLPFAYKYGYKYRFKIDYKNKHFTKLLFISIPIIISVSINQVNVLVDRTLASQLTIGAISALNYSNRLNFFVQGVFITTIVMVVYPQISKLAVKKDINSMKKTINEAIGLINLLVLPIILGILTFSDQIVKLVYERGAFDSIAVQMTSASLFYYSIGLLGIAIRDIISNVFYSLQDTKTPMVLAGFSMLLNIILNFILVKYMGIGGLAFATSISALIGASLLILFLKKKIGNLGISQIFPSFFKISLASCVSIGVSYTFQKFLFIDADSNKSMFITIIISCFLYVILIILLKVSEVHFLVQVIKEKIKIKKV